MRRRDKEEQWVARHEAERALPSGKYPPEDIDARALKRRKLRVVAAVRGGMISLPQALERFGLTVEEFIQWELDVGKELARKKRQAGKKRRTRRI